MRRVLTIALGASLAAASICALTTESLAQGGAPKGGKPLIKVTQGMPAKDINFLPWYLAAGKGFFAEEGLEVALPAMTAQVSVPALVSKQIEFAIGSSSARAAYQGAPVKVLMYAFSRFPFIAVAAKEIKTYKDLSGKVAATSSICGSDDTITKMLLGREKVVDYKLIPLGIPSARAAALVAGQIQFTLQDPLTAYRLEKEGYTVLGPADDVHPLPSGGYAVHEEMFSQKPDVVRAWLRATIKALLYEKRDPEGAADFAVAELGIDRDLALRALKHNGNFIDDRDPGGASEKALIQITEDDFTQLKMAGDPVAMAKKVHDFSLLRQAQRELGIKCTAGYQC